MAKKSAALEIVPPTRLSSEEQAYLAFLVGEVQMAQRMLDKHSEYLGRLHNLKQGDSIDFATGIITRG